jgi:signal transduction histidine kinase
MQFIVYLSSVLCVAAGLVAGAHLVRRQLAPPWFWPLATGFVVLAVWILVVLLYLRAPFSPLRAQAVLAAVCLAPAPWLFVALTLCEAGPADVLRRWKVLLIGQAATSVLAAAAMWMHGMDWLTGIASEPAVVLTQWGIAAVAVSVIPACAALVVFAVRLGGDVTTMPAVWVGAVGAICGALWVPATLLWRGYLAVTPLVSAAALCGTAAAVWSVGVLQRLPTGRPLAPSRRLIYGASAASLIAAYLLVARFALNWAVDLSSHVIRAVLPLAVFATAAGLIVILGSQRIRHRLWVAVGRYLFRSKHDYGEVWIRLAELVSAARDASDLLRRAAAFCRDLLCVGEVSIWLTDSAGRLSRSAVAAMGDVEPTQCPAEKHAGVDPPSAVDAGPRVPGATAPEDGMMFAQAIGAAFVCPMRANGQLLGLIAIGPRQSTHLDEEDRRIVGYISAQLGSALGLYRLGEEIADAREIGSFHRVSAFVLHDLKNLVAQQSFVLENAGRFRGDPTFVADALAAFEDSTNRMRALIGRLRSKEPTAQSRHTPCDLVELLREMLATPRIALRGGGTVRLVIPEQVETCPLTVDGSALTQVFSNLLVNAVESLPADSGEVVVALEKVAEGWRVEVRDNGRGMSEAYLRNDLFHPFRTTKDGGLGIGLYQCKTIVEAVGGTITVSSKENVGTRVAVTLPAGPAKQGGGAATIVGVQYGQTHSSSH